MKLTELRKVIREEVKAAIQEELKDILLEAVKSPKSTITETQTVSKPNPEAQKAFRQQMLSQMASGNGNMTLTSNDTNTFVPTGMATSEGSALPPGNVGLDQIMGIINNK